MNGADPGSLGEGVAGQATSRPRAMALRSPADVPARRTDLRPGLEAHLRTRRHRP